MDKHQLITSTSHVRDAVPVTKFTEGIEDKDKDDHPSVEVFNLLKMMSTNDLASLSGVALVNASKIKDAVWDSYSLHELSSGDKPGDAANLTARNSIYDAITSIDIGRLSAENKISVLDIRRVYQNLLNLTISSVDAQATDVITPWADQLLEASTGDSKSGIHQVTDILGGLKSLYRPPRKDGGPKKPFPPKTLFSRGSDAKNYMKMSLAQMFPNTTWSASGLLKIMDVAWYLILEEDRKPFKDLSNLDKDRFNRLSKQFSETGQMDAIEDARCQQDMNELASYVVQEAGKKGVYNWQWSRPDATLDVSKYSEDRATELLLKPGSDALALCARQIACDSQTRRAAIPAVPSNTVHDKSRQSATGGPPDTPSSTAGFISQPKSAYGKHPLNHSRGSSTPVLRGDNGLLCNKLAGKRNISDQTAPSPNPASQVQSRKNITVHRINSYIGPESEVPNNWTPAHRWNGSGSGRSNRMSKFEAQLNERLKGTESPAMDSDNEDITASVTEASEAIKPVNHAEPRTSKASAAAPKRSYYPTTFGRAMRESYPVSSRPASQATDPNTSMQDVNNKETRQPACIHTLAFRGHEVDRGRTRAPHQGQDRPQATYTPLGSPRSFSAPRPIQHAPGLSALPPRLSYASLTQRNTQARRSSSGPLAPLNTNRTRTSDDITAYLRTLKDNLENSFSRSQSHYRTIDQECERMRSREQSTLRRRERERTKSRTASAASSSRTSDAHVQKPLPEFSVAQTTRAVSNDSEVSVPPRPRSIVPDPEHSQEISNEDKGNAQN
ncbi:hypothetical protein B0J11DRAFT_614954 [Dendryphion nanum]|uniref:HMG box domain-containing protein n=1 Tax=Dendryphion nanum TaxID=256645 RepID=A0A9P9DUP1_9PLEO|nr:hypothetical protein B0J11DRAFT_614954 [Dendryphion nanum]